jgi:hypothetical protein
MTIDELDLSLLIEDIYRQYQLIDANQHINSVNTQQINSSGLTLPDVMSYSVMRDARI